MILAMADERIVWVRDARYSFSVLGSRLVAGDRRCGGSIHGRDWGKA